MKRLLWSENVGGRVEHWWRHTGDKGQECLTVETVQDVEPVFDEVKRLSDQQQPGSFFRYRGSVPATLFNELVKQSSITWGVTVRQAFAEIMQGNTDRAQGVLRMLRDGRDYRKLQADKQQRYVGGKLIHGA